VRASTFLCLRGLRGRRSGRGGGETIRGGGGRGGRSFSGDWVDESDDLFWERGWFGLVWSMIHMDRGY
jgi:hypothetical protein